MGLLTKIAQIAAKIVIGIDTFGPLAKSVANDKYDRYIDVVADYTTKAADVVVQAEIFGNALALSGQDKLKAATPAMAQLILKSDLMVGQKIKNPVLFEKGVASITSGFADVLNSLDESGVR